MLSETSLNLSVVWAFHVPDILYKEAEQPENKNSESGSE